MNERPYHTSLRYTLCKLLYAIGTGNFLHSIILTLDNHKYVDKISKQIDLDKLVNSMKP